MQEITNYYPQRAQVYVTEGVKRWKSQSKRDEYIRGKAIMWESMAKSFGESETAKEIELGVLVLANYLNREDRV